MKHLHYTNHNDDNSAIEQIIDARSGLIITYKNKPSQESALNLERIAYELKNNNAINDIFFYRLLNKLSDEMMAMINLAAKNRIDSVKLE
jgi:hypothetical protein